MNCYRCQANCWDHEWFERGSKGATTEVIRCAFCGVLQTRVASATMTSPRPACNDSADGFVFDSGRFEGKTIPEVIAHPRGREYLKWASGNVGKWKNAIEHYMNNAAPSA